MSQPRSIAFLLSLLLALGGCARAAEPSITPDETAEARASGSERERGDAETARAAPRIARPILYVVRGVEPPSYLFGTIHVAVSAERALGEEGLALVERSRVLITELSSDIDHAALLVAMLLPEGESLREHLGEERFTAITGRIKEAPPAVVDRLAPWAAMLQAGAEDMKRIAASRGGEPEAGMDAELQRLAKRRGIPNLGLESVDDQIAIFTGIPPELVLELIDEGLSEEGHALAERLYDAYLAGDDGAILSITEEEHLKSEAPALYERLLPARNKAWMPALTEEIRRGGAFIAVGAGHLVGEEGLVALLRAEGFEVERSAPPAH